MKVVKVTIQYGGSTVMVAMLVPADDEHSLRQVKNLLETNGRVLQIKSGRKVTRYA